MPLTIKDKGSVFLGALCVMCPVKDWPEDCADRWSAWWWRRPERRPCQRWRTAPYCTNNWENNAASSFRSCMMAQQCYFMRTVVILYWIQKSNVVILYWTQKSNVVILYWIQKSNVVILYWIQKKVICLKLTDNQFCTRSRESLKIDVHKACAKQIQAHFNKWLTERFNY